MTPRHHFLLALAFLAAPIVAHADGFTELLARYDLNGNGLLEPHERALLAAVKTSDATALASLPVVCDGDPASGESASAGGASANNQQAPQANLARHVRLRWEPFAEELPQDGDQPDETEAQASAAGYEPQAPTPPQPRQVVQIRNAVHYRMLLNEQQVQSRPQSFAQAATFGPMVGRVRHYPRPGGGYAIHSCCAPSRAAFYLAGY